MKDRGVCITPRELAEELARSVLEPSNRPLTGVLDPACGDGALLAAAWRIGRSQGLRPDRLFGFEVDDVLASRARARLRALLPGEDGERAARNVITTDALDPDLCWPPGTVVVANPPWVSFSGRQSRRSAGDAGRVGGGWPSLHGAFLERIAAHVAGEGARAGVLLPAPVLDGETYGALRREVTGRVELACAPRELGENAFPGVIEPACLLVLRPRGEEGDGSSAPWLASEPEEDLARLDAFPRLPPRCFGDPGVHSGNAARELIVRAGRPDLPGVREGRDLTPYRLGPPRLRLNVELERTPERASVRRPWSATGPSPSWSARRRTARWPPCTPSPRTFATRSWRASRPRSWRRPS